MRQAKQLVLVALCCLSTGAALGAEQLYDVRQFGAKPDGKTLSTESIQRAIDRCAADGGGTVYLPPGAFLSGTIYLKSRVTLRLAAGCTLLGSTELKDYPPTVPALRSYTDNYTDKSLIYGEKLEGIAITGRGTIDGQGRAFTGPYKVRPYTMRLIQCRGVTVEGVTLRDSPMWMQHYLACDDVRIHGITVRSRVNANNDGINIDSCHRVVISDCNVSSGDDALVLKSTTGRPCRSVAISNCVLSSYCNALKMGTESNGGFENVVITGCAIYDTRLAGLALEIVDGGTMDRVVVSGLTMQRVGTPIFLRLGNRARPFEKEGKKPGIGRMRNVTISNVEATGAGATGCAVAGLPEAKIENLTLSNVRLSFAGDGSRQDAARAIPENPEAYPEYSMFGRLPAYGFYCRHVRGLRLDGVQLQTAKPDLRHALVCDDVEDLVVDGLDGPFAPGACATIRLVQVKGASIRGCRPQTPVETFLKLEGDASGRVVLTGNDFSLVGKAVDAAPEVPSGAVSLVGCVERTD